MTTTDNNSTSATLSISTQHLSILLCPGQGAQHVGMGKAWSEKFPIAAKTFALANETLGISLTDLCFNGPEDQLNRTDIAQAAIYTTSVASYTALLESGKIGSIAALAGLSLGEFTALHLAGAFDFVSGLKLVRLRGQAMQAAAEASRGGMVALIGADDAQADAICAEALVGAAAGEVLVPANYNCPGQIVISGSAAACERSLKVAEAKGIKGTALKVAGAFHSPLMQPAADQLAKALEQVQWGTLKYPVYSNVTAQPHANDAASIKKLLVQQLTSPVRWGQSMSAMIGQFPASDARYVELAPNKTLGGLMRRIDRAVKVENHAEPTA